MIINSDALTGLRQLPEGSVHMAITSPPYFGLRNYERCPCASVQSGSVGSSTLEPGPKSGNTQIAKERVPDMNCKKCSGTGKQADLTYIWDAEYGCPHQWIDEGTCVKCGAWRGQLGLEPTPELYIQHLVSIFHEMKRVLRDDGVFWLNIGDSYSSSGGSKTPKSINGAGTANNAIDFGVRAESDLENGNLLMIPFRLALALQSDGWIVRSDTIWCKGASFGPYVGNVMPEPCNGIRWERHKIEPERVAEVADNPDREDGGRAVGAAPWNVWKDCPGCEVCSPNDGLVLRKQAWRPTKSHEYLFLLVKSPIYFCDKDAISEPLSRSSYERMEQDSFWEQEGGEKDGINPNRSASKSLENLAKQYERAGASARANHAYGEIAGRPIGPSSFARPVLKKNVRSVWQISPHPYKEAHFAVFPRALVEPCIKVSTADKVCSKCGSQWARVIRTTISDENLKRFENYRPRWDTIYDEGKAGIDPYHRPISAMFAETLKKEQISVGFRPTCTCKAPPTEATVLDPFAGSGTTLAVARSLGRKSIGIEPNPVYTKLIEKRLNETPPAAFHAEDFF